MYIEDVVKLNDDYNHRDKWYGWETWTKNMYCQVEYYISE